MEGEKVEWIWIQYYSMTAEYMYMYVTNSFKIVSIHLMYMVEVCAFALSQTIAYLGVNFR